MCSISEALGELTTAVSALAGARVDTLGTHQRLDTLAALARLSRRLAAVEYELIAGLDRTATPGELGDTVANTLARVTLTTKTEAKARIRDAEDIAARVAITGEPLPARFPTVADKLRSGLIDRTHVREIQRFFHKIPATIPTDERDHAEAFLADLATTLLPTELRAAADHLLAYMGHDDDYTDADRARRRGFTWSRQDGDGMSKATLWATPELRTQIDAIMAAWAAPGKCNPNDETPCIDADPDTPTAQRDTRTPAQRRHDALSALTRAMLASGHLGQHNGLPVTVIVSTTLQELQSGTGKAHTGGGTVLPMTDVIRMAAHAHHYLLIYDGATEIPLWLGRTKRIASPGQRIVLHRTDRGCTFPGCDMPGYLSQVHHAVRDWIDGGRTNIDELTFGCPTHHEYVTNRGWTTHKNKHGHTEWKPPPHAYLPGGTNNHHHPERYLQPPGDPPRP